MVRRVRRAIGLWRVFRVWLRDDPARFWVVAVSHLPVRVASVVRGALAQAGAIRWMPSLWFLLARRSGRDVAGLDRLVVRCSPDRRHRLARLLAASELPALAAAVLRGLPPGPAHAEVRFRAGEYSEARELLRSLPDSPDVRRLAERIDGELGILARRERRATSRRRRETRGDPSRRVMHLVTNALPLVQAGYTFRTQDVAKAQAGVGLEPFVVTPWGWPVLQGFPGVAPEAEVDGIPYRRLLPGRRIPHRPDARLELGVAGAIDLARRHEPALVHAATPFRNGAVAAAVGEACGLPFVYEVRGFLEDTWAFRNGPGAIDSERYRLERERETTLMRAADAVVTLSETMRTELLDRGVDPARIRVAPNAVPPDLLSSPVRSGDLRERLGVPAGDFVVGAVSTLDEYEGFDTLIEAIAILRHEHGTRLAALIVGDGPARPRLRSLVRDLELSDAVFLPGRASRADASPAYDILDLFVVPRRDTRVCRFVSPLKVVEAMGRGKPLVVSDLPALTEFTAGGAGEAFPAGDPFALAKVLGDLHDSPGRRAALAAAGRDLVAQRMTWNRVAVTYRKLFDDLTA